MSIDRISVAGWPRSGTTWFSNCLAECLGYQWHGYEKEPAEFRPPGVVIRSHYKPQEIGADSKAILVVRDPRSVVVSHFFMMKQYDAAWNGDIGDYIAGPFKCGIRGGLPVGGWSSFYETWLDNGRIGIIARHEDTILDRAATMRWLCAWVGVERSEPQIASVCKKWMGTTRESYDGGTRNRIEGGSEVWQKFLTPENEQAIIEQAGATMERLGYGH